MIWDKQSVFSTRVHCVLRVGTSFVVRRQATALASGRGHGHARCTHKASRAPARMGACSRPRTFVSGLAARRRTGAIVTQAECCARRGNRERVACVTDRVLREMYSFVRFVWWYSPWRSTLHDECPRWSTVLRVKPVRSSTCACVAHCDAISRA